MPMSRNSLPFLAKGVRINAIARSDRHFPYPGPTPDLWLSSRRTTGRPLAPRSHDGADGANVMAFLNSDAAAWFNGVTLLVDDGHFKFVIIPAASQPASRSIDLPHGQNTRS